MRKFTVDQDHEDFSKSPVFFKNIVRHSESMCHRWQDLKDPHSTRGNGINSNKRCLEIRLNLGFVVSFFSIFLAYVQSMYLPGIKYQKDKINKYIYTPLLLN